MEKAYESIFGIRHAGPDCTESVCPIPPIDPIIYGPASIKQFPPSIRGKYYNISAKLDEKVLQLAFSKIMQNYFKNTVHG